MTQKQFYVLIVVCNILLLFVYIFKQNSLISLHHAIQKKEVIITELQQKKDTLFNELQRLQQHTIIKHRAEKELGLRKTNLKQIVSEVPDKKT